MIQFAKYSPTLTHLVENYSLCFSEENAELGCNGLLQALETPVLESGPRHLKYHVIFKTSPKLTYSIYQ